MAEYRDAFGKPLPFLNRTLSQMFGGSQGKNSRHPRSSNYTPPGAPGYVPPTRVPASSPPPKTSLTMSPPPPLPRPLPTPRGRGAVASNMNPVALPATKAPKFTRRQDGIRGAYNNVMPDGPVDLPNQRTRDPLKRDPMVARANVFKDPAKADQLAEMMSKRDRLNRASARVDATIDTLDERMAEGRAERRAEFNREREAYQNKIENMTPDEFREEVSSTNRGSGNYFDMTKRGPYGITDVVVRPRSAKENFDSRLANMSPEELKKEAFTSRQSGVRGSGPYGGTATYTQPGGMAGREAALAGSSLDYGAGTGPVEQPPRKSVDMGTVVGYDRAQQIAASTGGEYGDFKPGETINLGDGAVFTVAKDTKDPLRAIKGDSVLLGTQGRFGGPRRDGEVRQGPNGEYVPGGNLNTNEKFMAQRERRAQRRADALATRRSMLPYRTRGIPMNAIFLDQEGMADPLMNAGMFQEASRRDQVNDQRSEMARQFDARMQQSGDQFDANLGLQTRQQQFAEDEALRRERENRRDGRRQRRQDRRTYRDGEELRGEELRRQQLENDKLQAEVDRLTEDDPIADEVRDREGSMLIGEQQDQANLYINMPIATDDQKVEYLDKVLNDRDMSIEDKKRAAQRAGVTSMDQLYRLIRSSGYAGVRQYGPFSAAGPADGTGIGIVFDRYEDPTTAETRESVLGGGKSIFGG